MQGPDQQAYDRGTSIFSPDGRLYQVEYAREAVERGTAAIGVRTESGVVLVVDLSVTADLMERESVEKLHLVDEHVGVASAGHVADGRLLVDYMRRDAQLNQRRYGEPIDPESLAKHVSDVVQQFTQIGGVRPFGCSLIVAGIDRDDRPRLFETDPSGALSEWAAIAMGAERGTIQGYLEEQYTEDLSLSDGVDLALRALAASTDGEFDESGVGVATIDAAAGRFEFLSDDAVREHVEGLDLDSEGRDDESDVHSERDADAESDTDLD